MRRALASKEGDPRRWASYICWKHSQAQHYAKAFRGHLALLSLHTSSVQVL